MKNNTTHPTQTLTVTSTDGTVITVDRTGQGHPVVCVDGAMSTRSLGPGKMLAPHLADAFTVYTYDRRGRGDSGDAPYYEVQREIEDLAAVIAAAGGAAMVFGHSSGCVLALEAARAGLPITHLALYEPPFVIDHTRPAVGDAWRPTRPARPPPSTASPTCASRSVCCWAARARNGSPTQPMACSTCCPPANSSCSPAKRICSSQR